MNPQLLIAHFNRISGAPDAIPRLRRFILDLAVRGKLVEQNPNDELASELLKRIKTEKTRLVNEEKIRSPRIWATSNEDTDIFPIPTSWLWCHLSEIGSIIGGGTPPSSDLDNFAPGGSGIAWLTPADLGKHSHLYISRGARDLTAKGLSSSSATVMPKGSVLFTSRAPIGYTAIAMNEISTNQGFKSVVPFIAECNLYIAVYFRAFRKWIDDKASGTTFREVSGKIVAKLPFPLPPLAEQHRIVAKVDELMALCDRLEAKQRELETRRDRLTSASHHHLNNGRDAEVSRKHANFFLSHLPRLTEGLDQITRLRQTVLSLALRGQLVAQDPTDEPATELLLRINKQRDELLHEEYPNAAEARAQLQKQQEQVLPNGLHSLPQGWHWATLIQCSSIVVDCHNKTAPYSRTGVILLRTTNVRNGKLNLNEPKFVDEQTYARWSARCPPESGDILITREAPMGEVCIVPEGMRVCLGQRMMLIRLVPNTLDRRFLLYSLRDPNLMNRVQDKPVGATVQHLRVGGVETLLIAVPPIEEQRRMVAKLDELMAVCDRLELQLTNAQAESRCLLEAVLHHALIDT
jgi:type I restriction enzyme S subunit